jgi:protein BUR2
LTQNIAATAVFLANKTEENCFKTKNIIIAVARVAQKNKDLIIDEQSKEYWRWRDAILANEELMLEILTFDLMLSNPYEEMFNCLKRLNVDHDKEIRKAAWTFCNDAALTNLPVLMEPTDIALASIYFGSILSKTRIADIHDEPWWRYLQADEQRIAKAISIMSTTYRDHPLWKTESGGPQGSPAFSLENTRRRADTLPSQGGSISRDATPMDLDSRSPRGGWRANGDRDETESRTAAGDESVTAEVQAAPGDSDAALKAAANDLDAHRTRPNGQSLLSPGKRKGHEREMSLEDERAAKRGRRPDGDD